MIKLFLSKEDREKMNYYANLPEKERLGVLGEAILRTNNRHIANAIMGKELNDIEFQQFKRFLRRLGK